MRHSIIFFILILDKSTLHSQSSIVNSGYC